MFNKNSGLVQVWVRLIKSGTYTINNVPNLYNLQDIVVEVLQETETEAQKATAYDIIIGGIQDDETD